MSDQWPGEELTVGQAPTPAEASGYPGAPIEIDPAAGRNQPGSGGIEDDGEGSTDGQPLRAPDGSLYVNIEGNGKPYEPPESAGLDALGRGVADTITMGALPRLGAVIGGAEGALSGEGFSAAYDRVLKDNQSTIANDEKDHPYYRIAGQLLGGLAIPVGLEGVGFKAGAAALREGVSLQEARGIAAAAVRNRLAAMGGGTGVIHGYLSSDDLASPEAVGNAAIEGALGAAGGMAFGAAGQAIAPRQAARAAAARALPLTEGQRTLAAADRQGIDVLPADVGGPGTRRLTAAAAQAPLSAAPVISGAQRAVEQAQGVRNRIAASVGHALDPEAAGNSARDGALAYIQSSGREAGNLYRAAEAASQGVRVTPTRALETLDANIAELSDVPGGAPAVQRLQGLRDSLAQGDVSVAGIRNMRTVLRQEFIKDGLRGSDTERRVNQVLDAASGDLTDSLNSAGRGDAARLYSQADKAYRERINTIDTVIKPLIGTRENPLSGEQIIKKLTADLQGNNGRSVRFLRTLPEEEQANTRASIIGALGRQSAGAQNVEGDGFSLAKFLTDWNKVGETAKRAYFGDEVRSALNDLARVAQGTKEAQGYANRSNTSGGIWGNLGVLAGSAAASPVAAGIGLGTQLISGRLLASPRFARWLARAPRTQLSDGAYLDRLSRIARAEPAIANDVLGLQAHLQQVLRSGGSAPLAAQDEQNRRTVPPQEGGRE